MKHAWHFCTTANKCISIWHRATKLKKICWYIVYTIPENYSIGKLWISSTGFMDFLFTTYSSPKVEKKRRKRRWDDIQRNISWVNNSGMVGARCVAEHISQYFAYTAENSRRLTKLESYLYMVILGIAHSQHEIIQIWDIFGLYLRSYIYQGA